MRRYTTCNNIHNGKMKIMINKSANMSRYRSCTAKSKGKMRIRSIVSRSTRPRCSEGHTHTHTHSDSWSFSSVLKLPGAHDHRCGFTTRVCVCARALSTSVNVHNKLHTAHFPSCRAAREFVAHLFAWVQVSFKTCAWRQQQVVAVCSCSFWSSGSQ